MMSTKVLHFYSNYLFILKPENVAGSDLEDEDTDVSSNMIRNSITQNPLGIIRSYRRVNLYRERMNRLLQLKNHYYPICSAFWDKPFLHTPTWWTSNCNGHFLQKKKSCHGITIRKNKQSESTAEGSTSHLNRARSSQSNIVGITSNMIPSFPASNDNDAHHCDTVSNRSPPSHFTEDSPFNIFLSQNPANYKQFMPLLGKSQRILFENLW